VGLQLLLLLLLIFVAWFSLTPVYEPKELFINDKLAHGLTYLMLSIVADHAFATSRFGVRKMLWLFAFGFILEILQSYVPGRDYSFFDMLANASGIGIYWLLCQTILERTPTPVPSKT
jgi:VanZ family protein